VLSGPGITEAHPFYRETLESGPAEAAASPLITLTRC
jgi:hypothetical protein